MDMDMETFTLDRLIFYAARHALVNHPGSFELLGTQTQLQEFDEKRISEFSVANVRQWVKIQVMLSLFRTFLFEYIEKEA